MAVSTEILRSYVAPRTVIRRQLAAGPHEARALAVLMAACLLIWVSTLPGLARQAHLAPDVPLQARIGAALLAWMFLAPLLFYALAALSHVLARLFGGRGDGYGARLALFWALLAASPVWLLHGMVAGFIGPGPAQVLVAVVLAAAFLYIWLAGLIEAERLGAPADRPEVRG